MNFEIEKKEYNKIAEIIHSDQSPVSIDAKKTHILILHKLQEISSRLVRIEEEVKKIKN